MAIPVKLNVPWQHVAWLLATVAIAVTAGVLIDNYREGQEAKQTVEVQGEIAQATSGTVDEGVMQEAARQAYELGVKDARNDFKSQQAEDKRNEPETAARADRPVPRSVRDNLNKRRLARERLRCAQGECAEGDTAATPPER